MSLQIARQAVFPRLNISDEQSAELDSLRLGPSTSTLASEVTVIMKATRLCNLRCTYCHSWRSGPNQVMAWRVLAQATAQILNDSNVKSATFVWHGGETLLLPKEFFEHALALQLLFKRSDQTVTNALQTNATLVTDDWARFLSDHHISVGVSIDGLAADHDAVRLDKKGRGTWDRVVRGIEALQRNDVRFGALMVVTPRTVQGDPCELLTKLASLGIPGLALLNQIDVDPDARPDPAKHLPFEDFVSWLRDLYPVWNDAFRDEIGIREFLSLENNLRRSRPMICVHAETCMGRFLTVEPDGQVGPCDKFQGDRSFHAGSLGMSPLADILDGPRFREFKRNERLTKKSTEACKYRSICNGGCIHDAKVSQATSSQYSNCCGLSGLIETISNTSMEGSLDGHRNYAFRN